MVRRHVTKRRVSPYRIVEAVDVVGDPRVRIGLRGLRPGRLFVLQRGKEGLGHGIVPAIGLAAHARHEAPLCERAPEVMAGVLATPIRVEHQAGLSGRTVPRIQEHLLDQVIGHTVAEAVAQHLTGLDAQDHRVVQPALACRDGGDVAHPRRGRAGDVELPREQVLGDRTGVTAVRGA